MSENNLLEMLAASDNELPKEIIQQLLSRMEANSEDENSEEYGEDHITKLQSLYEIFNEEIEFKPGQLVIWKEGLKNRRLPLKNQPAIVVKVLDTPLYADKNEGTPYFQEPLDLVLGVIGSKKGEFLIFHYDKRRFRLHT